MHVTYYYNPKNCSKVVNNHHTEYNVVNQNGIIDRNENIFIFISKLEIIVCLIIIVNKET